jgi:hypothetical protein
MSSEHNVRARQSCTDHCLPPGQQVTLLHRPAALLPPPVSHISQHRLHSIPPHSPPCHRRTNTAAPSGHQAATCSRRETAAAQVLHPCIPTAAATDADCPGQLRARLRTFLLLCVLPAAALLPAVMPAQTLQRCLLRCNPARRPVAAVPRALVPYGRIVSKPRHAHQLLTAQLHADLPCTQEHITSQARTPLVCTVTCRTASTGASR